MKLPKPAQVQTWYGRWVYWPIRNMLDKQAALVETLKGL